MFLAKVKAFLFLISSTYSSSIPCNLTLLFHSLLPDNPKFQWKKKCITFDIDPKIEYCITLINAQKEKMDKRFWQNPDERCSTWDCFLLIIWTNRSSLFLAPTWALLRPRSPFHLPLEEEEDEKTGGLREKMLVASRGLSSSSSSTRSSSLNVLWPWLISL